MTYELFWENDPTLVKAYRRAEDMRKKRENQVLWLSGMYTAEALRATVGNMFSKGNKHKYPAEPYPITAEDARERREREQRAKMERIKARFTAKALSINSRMGGQNDDS